MDEIGIYYRVTEGGADVDADVFARAMERNFGSDLILAEGFDGIFIPDYLVFDGAPEGHTMDGGSLFLAPGSGVGFSAIPEYFESLSVSIEWETEDVDGQSESSIVLESPEGDEIFFDLGVRNVSTDEDPSTVFRFEHSEEKLLVYHGDEVTVVDSIGKTLLIRNRGVTHDLELRSVLLVKNLVQSEE